MMTLDEAIKHAREKAEELKKQGSICCDSLEDTNRAEKCLECAKGHEQLAEWLTELKAYREAKGCCSLCRYADSCDADYIRHAQTTEGTIYKNKHTGTLKFVTKNKKCIGCITRVYSHFEPKENNK